MEKRWKVDSRVAVLIFCAATVGGLLVVRCGKHLGPSPGVASELLDTCVPTACAAPGNSCSTFPVPAATGNPDTDTPNIQNTINSASNFVELDPVRNRAIVQFQAGTYSVRPGSDYYCLHVYRYITLQGAARINGAIQTTIQLHSVGNATTQHEWMNGMITSPAPDVSGFQMYDLRLDGNSDNNHPIATFHDGGTPTSSYYLTESPGLGTAMVFAQGTKLMIQNCEFTNFAGGWIIYAGTAGYDNNGNGLLNCVTVDNCKFTNTGTNSGWTTFDGGFTYHASLSADNVGWDHSSLYTGATDFTISNSTLSARTDGGVPGTCTGTATALEMHGNRQTVSSNTVMKYYRLGFVVAEGPVACTQTFSHNTGYGLAEGIGIYGGYDYLPKPTYALQNVTIEANQINIQTAVWRNGGNGVYLYVGEQPKYGWGPIDNLRISNNWIEYDRVSSQYREGDWSSAGISLNWNGYDNTLSNLTIENNNIRYPLSNGILLWAPLNGVHVNNNHVLDCGFGAHSQDVPQLYSTAVAVRNDRNDPMTPYSISNVYIPDQPNSRTYANSFEDDRPTKLMWAGLSANNVATGLNCNYRLDQAPANQLADGGQSFWWNGNGDPGWSLY